MKKKSKWPWNNLRGTVAGLLLVCGMMVAASSTAFADTPAAKEQSLEAPNGLQVTVKMIGPVTQTTDLQIICILRHDPAGDQYIEAMKDLNAKLGGLLSSLRDRGDFVGAVGETLLLTPPANSISPRRLLLIGVGQESKLTLGSLQLVGRIAARETVRLNVAHVSFAPMLRDQGSSRIDVGEGGAAFVEQFLLAYDTEKRLQTEGLSPKDDLKDITIEAGPKFFDSVVQQTTTAIASAAARIKERSTDPYHAP